MRTCCLLFAFSFGFIASVCAQTPLKLELAQWSQQPCTNGYTFVTKAKGGTPPYQYSVFLGPTKYNYSTNPTLYYSGGWRPIPDSVYTFLGPDGLFQVMDHQGKKAILEIHLPVITPTPLALGINVVQQAHCQYDSTSIQLIPYGGRPPYIVRDQNYQVLSPPFTVKVNSDQQYHLEDSLGCTTANYYHVPPYFGIRQVSNYTNCTNSTAKFKIDAYQGQIFQHSFTAPPNAVWIPSDTIIATLATQNIYLKDQFGCNYNTSLIGIYMKVDGFELSEDTCSLHTGSLKAYVTRGVPPFQYRLLDYYTSAVVVPWQASSLFTGLAGGYYNFEVQDFNGCTATSNYVNPVYTTKFNFNAQITPSNCTTPTGSVTVNPIPFPTPPGGFTYSLNYNGPFQSSNTFSGLAANSGIYIYVNGGTNCVSQRYFSVPSDFRIDSLVLQNLECANSKNGSITVQTNYNTGHLRYRIEHYKKLSIAGVIGQYGQYNISSYNYPNFIGSSLWQSSPTFPNIDVGDFVKVYVQDTTNNNCITSFEQNITNTRPKAIAKSTNQTCVGGDGKVRFTYANPADTLGKIYKLIRYNYQPRYEMDPTTNFFRFFPEDTFVSTLPRFSSLVEGGYGFEIWDSNLGCMIQEEKLNLDSSAFAPVYVARENGYPSYWQLPYSTTQLVSPTSCGTNNGSLHLFVDSLLSQQIDNQPWSTDTTLSNLTTGWHLLKIVRQNGCTTHVRVFVDLPNTFGIQSSFVVTNAILGLSIGVVKLKFKPHIASLKPYKLFLNNTSIGTTMADSLIIDSLPEGNYNFRLEDQSGCSADVNFILGYPEIPGQRILGRVYYDNNGDNLFQSGVDEPAINTIVYTDDPNYPQIGYITTTDSAGNYMVAANVANTTRIFTTAPPYCSVVTPSQGYLTINTVNNGGPYFGNDLILYRTPNVLDLSALLTSYSMISNRDTNLFQFVVWNRGTVAAPSRAEILFDTLIDYSRSIPNHNLVYGPYHYAWNQPWIDPDKYRSTLIYSFPDSNGVMAGTPFNNLINLTTTGTDVDLSNNSFQNMGNFYDPAFKTDTQEDLFYHTIKANHLDGTEARTAKSGERLYFTVRFRNESTQNVNHVVVIDTLPPQIKSRELRFESASHQGRMQVHPYGAVSYEIKNANLKPATVDKFQSIGFFVFSVPVWETAACSSSMINSAVVYLDNKQFKTDTLLLKISKGAPSVENLVLPTNVGVNTAFTPQITNPVAGRNYQIDFGPYSTPSSVTGTIPTSVRYLTKGKYRVRLVVEDAGCRTVLEKDIQVGPAFVSGRSPELESKLTLYPVPAFDELYLRVEDANPASWQFGIIDLQGRTIKALETIAPNTSTLVNTSNLPAGIYILKGISKDGRVSQGRFNVIH